MNNKRRDKLRTAMNFLERASEIIEYATDEENDCLDNMPENLQASDRYERMESIISSLEDANSSINEAIASVKEALV